MSPVLRAFASGAAGVFVSEAVTPHLDKVLKPDTEFMKKVSKAAAAGVGSAVAWYALGFIPGMGGGK